MSASMADGSEDPNPGSENAASASGATETRPESNSKKTQTRILT